MVQAHKKSKPKKRNTVGKAHGKETDTTKFQSQLDILGLKIIHVTSDGNCFFRAMADQLEGNEEEHKKYRHMVVQYILKHRDVFEPFIEDDVPFDEYCKSMEEDGTWAGNMELQAASLVTQSNICIHRLMSPRWYIRNFHDHDATMVHLSYHDDEHYNSVRLEEDSCKGRAMPIVIKVDADISAASHLAKAKNNKFRSTSCENLTNMELVKLVMRGTGCVDYSKVEQVLKEVDGDTDVAIEYLISEKGMDETFDNSDDLSCGSNHSYGPENRNCGQARLRDKSCMVDSCNPKSTLNYDDENKPKEKRFPQGTKKKQKMNGSAARLSSRASVINSRGKGKRGQNHGKGNADKKGLFHDIPGELPDVGALCI